MKTILYNYNKSILILFCLFGCFKNPPSDIEKKELIKDIENYEKELKTNPLFSSKKNRGSSKKNQGFHGKYLMTTKGISEIPDDRFSEEGQTEENKKINYIYKFDEKKIFNTFTKETKKIVLPMPTEKLPIEDFEPKIYKESEKVMRGGFNKEMKKESKPIPIPLYKRDPKKYIINIDGKILKYKYLIRGSKNSPFKIYYVEYAGKDAVMKIFSSTFESRIIEWYNIIKSDNEIKKTILINKIDPDIGPEIYEILKDKNGNIALIMEHLKRDYTELIKNPFDWAIKLFTNLDKMHQNNITHSDIKPDNFINTKFIDFEYQGSAWGGPRHMTAFMKDKTAKQLDIVNLAKSFIDNLTSYIRIINKQEIGDLTKKLKKEFKSKFESFNWSSEDTEQEIDRKNKLYDKQLIYARSLIIEYLPLSKEIKTLLNLLIKVSKNEYKSTGEVLKALEEAKKLYN